ncbi:hypothetical protein [Castellaniella sp.]|uniref:hypothetical protein n=1 Tax=Castellaniella sp. TaxID=1955812 RepID=UPI002A3682BE|nr:hypothetical protein [Castellaniella sp.]
MQTSPSAAMQAGVWSRPTRCPSGGAAMGPWRWSRYERLSFSMLGYTWGILVLAVAALHIFNYDLETKTSSTSGSHASFYESAQAIKVDQSGAQAPGQDEQ